MMGGPMAENILKKGHPLVVYDIDRKKVAQFVEMGAIAATDPADMARQARVLISMVDTTAQAEEVIVGPNGFIENAQQGDVIVTMSTIDPFAVRAMQQKLDAKGVALLDAPVPGIQQGAHEGTLPPSVGGHPDPLERARPALQPESEHGDERQGEHSDRHELRGRSCFRMFLV
jgi:3-hydroxyisobutyrate dehydrogenase-like beta-hydroxyacid dehydrogenase